jgi:hypothetical protein
MEKRRGGCWAGVCGFDFREEVVYEGHYWLEMEDNLIVNS